MQHYTFEPELHLPFHGFFLASLKQTVFGSDCKHFSASAIFPVCPL